MPQVSVIIPTHNRSDFLRSAIASVLNQTYEDFEIIVVDDASTDNTAEVVAAFKDERIKFMRHETNKGGSAARNTGIRASKYDYIAFLDDDDDWLPEKLRKQIEVLRSSPPEVGGVYTGYMILDRASMRVIRRYCPVKKGNLFHDLLVTNCVGSTSSMLLKRECLEKVGLFDESLPCSQDYDLWIRIAKEFWFECIQEPLFNYYIHQHTISTDLEGQTRGLEIMARKYSKPPLSRNFYTNQYLDIGVMYCLAGDVHKGRREFFRAIKLFPLQLRAYYNLGLSIFGSGKFRQLKEAERKAFASFAPTKRA